MKDTLATWFKLCNGATGPVCWFASALCGFDSVGIPAGSRTTDSPPFVFGVVRRLVPEIGKINQTEMVMAYGLHQWEF